SQPGTLHLALHLPFDLYELFEDPLLVFRGDADAGVRHAKHNPAVFFLRRCDPDVTFPGELERIRDQVAQYLRDLSLIHVEGRDSGSGFKNQLQAVSGQQRLQHATERAEELLYFKVPWLYIDL